jgi:hypothetical protein
MDFILRYRGRLPGKMSDSVDDKQRVRMALHSQLEELCRREEFFHECLFPDLITGRISGNKLEFNHDANHPGNDKQFCKLPIAGFDFVPLVHRQHYLYCQLDITWLRTERAGDIVRGGDLDNRLKTLFDALRMPHAENEVGREKPTTPSQRVFCLMDDDSLITKLSVSTHQMLEPRAEGERETDVDLLIHVRVMASRGTWGNMALV